MAQFSINRNRLIVNKIIGQRFGRLVVLELLPAIRAKLRRARCRCDCGKETITVFNALATGNTRSCGCLYRETRGIGTITHGKRNWPEWKIWSSLKQRCLNPKNPAYENYGGRGITVCDRWKGSFEAFIEDMGRKPSRWHSIDRIDNNGPYAPENCRWAVAAQQCRNQRTNRIATHNGQTMCLKDWCAHFGIVDYRTACVRVQRGMDIIKAASTPPVKAGPGWKNGVRVVGDK